jgi:NAD+ diphosphatase
MSFNPATGSGGPERRVHLICVTDHHRLIQRPGGAEPLTTTLLGDLAAEIEQSHYLGTFHGEPCHAVYLPQLTDQRLAAQGLEVVSLRAQLGEIPDDLFQLAGRALQTVNWYRDHQFCGRCGRSTRPDPVDRATVCDSCNAAFYPRLSPCVIVLIERGEHCLLAHHTRSRNTKYSALAGFIEPGETVEQALAREVAEEVGVRVSNSRYFSSQPWPFPGQLMLGFHADYAGGEIIVDGKEIDDADWFHARELPLVPSPSTISGQLIQSFVQRICGT